MSDRRYHRPRTTYDMKERATSLAEDLADEDTNIRGFHDALTVLVETLEDQTKNE